MTHFTPEQLEEINRIAEAAASKAVFAYIRSRTLARARRALPGWTAFSQQEEEEELAAIAEGKDGSPG